MGGDVPLEPRSDPASAPGPPSSLPLAGLSEPAVSSDSLLAAAAEEIFSDPPPMPTLSASSSGSATNPRWAAVDAARGGIRASFSSLSQAWGGVRLPEPKPASENASDSLQPEPAADLPDPPAVLSATVVTASTYSDHMVAAALPAVSMPSSEARSAPAAPSTRQPTPLDAPAAWRVSEDGGATCPRCAATVELAAVDEHSASCSGVGSSSGSSSALRTYASYLPALPAVALPSVSLPIGSLPAVTAIFANYRAPPAAAQTAPVDAAGSTKDDDENGGPWVCPHCTLAANSPLQLACRACGGQRPLQTVLAAADDAKLDDSRPDAASSNFLSEDVLQRAVSEDPFSTRCDNALEGFVCPCCLASFPVPEALVAHFDAHHAAEFDQRDAKVLRSEKAADSGPFWRKPATAATATAGAATTAAGKAADTAAAVPEVDLVCFCGASIPLSRLWPIAVLGPKPLGWGRRAAPATCAACKLPLCAAHAQEHPWPSNHACRPAFAAAETAGPSLAAGAGVWVCGPCVGPLEAAARSERQAWWKVRADAAATGELYRKPYVRYHGRLVVEDTALAKAGRVVEATYEAARYVPVVSTTVALAVGVANLSRQYGAYGIAGFLHRADIAKAVSELRLLVGEEHLQGLSAADCVAGLYYMTAFR